MIDTVSIDFIAGSHGHFLEYVCNRFIAHDPLSPKTPFNQFGASHMGTEYYKTESVFKAKHYSTSGLAHTNNIIRITFGFDDLLPLASVSILRAGDFGIDNDYLELNTFNKLNSPFYRSTIQSINASYPEISLTADTPDCPRHILREFFKIGFKYPDQHGLMFELNKLQYAEGNNVIDFEFHWFYNTNTFIDKITMVSEWVGTQISDKQELIDLHCQFLEKQIYTNHKSACDRIIDCIKNGKDVCIPKLTLFQESYINGVLETIYPIEMPFQQPAYFTTTKEIIDFICSKSKISP